MGGSLVRSAMDTASNTVTRGREGERKRERESERVGEPKKRKRKREIIYLLELVQIYKFNSYFYYKKQEYGTTINSDYPN